MKRKSDKFSTSFKHENPVKDVYILTNAANMSQQKFRGAIIWSRVTTLKFGFCWMKPSESVQVARILSFFPVAKAGFWEAPIILPSLGFDFRTAFCAFRRFVRGLLFSQKCWA